MTTVTVLHPGVEKTAAQSSATKPVLAPRIASFAGKRIALLENVKVNAAPILVALARRLQSQHGAGEVKLFKKRHAGESGAIVMPDIFAWKPDLALTGIGD